MALRWSAARTVTLAWIAERLKRARRSYGNIGCIGGGKGW